MGTLNSFADLMLDWKKVLDGCASNAAELGAAEPQRVVVEKLFKEAQDLKAQQDAHTASKQGTVQQLKDLLRDGREAVRRLRAVVKANLGTDNERLVQFGIAPNRKRAKKALALVSKPEVPPPTVSPPVGQVETHGSPEPAPTVKQ